MVIFNSSPNYEPSVGIHVANARIDSAVDHPSYCCLKILDKEAGRRNKGQAMGNLAQMAVLLYSPWHWSVTAPLKIGVNVMMA
jgi:hypothetical protein